MRADGRISEDRFSRLLSKIPTREAVDAAKVVGAAKRILPKGTADEFRQFLGETTGTRISPGFSVRLPRRRQPVNLDESPLFKGSWHTDLKYSLEDHPQAASIVSKLEEIQKRVVDNEGYFSIGEMDSMLGKGDKKFESPGKADEETLVERVDALHAFAHKDQLRPNFVTHAMRIKSVQAVEHFLRVTDLKPENYGPLWAVLSNCKTPAQVLQAASRIAGAKGISHGLLDFAVKNARWSDEDGHEHFGQLLDFAGRYSREKDKTQFLLANIDALRASVNQNGYRDNLDSVRHFFAVEGAPKVLSEGEMKDGLAYNFGGTTAFFDELKARLEKKAAFERELGKIHEKSKEEFTRLSEKTFQARGMPLTAPRFAELSRLRKLFANGETRALEAVVEKANWIVSDPAKEVERMRLDFDKAIALPLLSVSVDDGTFRENSRAVEEFFLNPATIETYEHPTLFHSSIMHYGHANIGLEKESYYSQMSQEERVVRQVCAARHYESFADYLNESLPLTDGRALEGDYLTRKVVSAVAASHNPSATSGVLKEGLQEIIALHQNYQTILEQAVKDAVGNGFNNRPEFEERVMSALPKRLDEKTARKLHEMIRETSAQMPWHEASG